jgi:hypothetical protein
MWKMWSTLLKARSWPAASQRFFAVFLDTVFQVLALSLVSVLTPYNPFNTAGSDMWSADPAGASPVC